MLLGQLALLKGLSAMLRIEPSLATRKTSILSPLSDLLVYFFVSSGTGMCLSGKAVLHVEDLGSVVNSANTCRAGLHKTQCFRGFVLT